MAKEKIKTVTDEEWLLVNSINRQFVDLYLDSLVDLSEETVKQYKSALKIYFRFIKENCRDIQFDKIKPREYLQYQNYLSKLGLSSSAISLKRSSISAFNDWIVTYYCDEYPTFHNYITKAIKRPPKAFVNEKKPLTPEELEKLEKYLIEKEEWQKLAFLTFTYSAGCRRKESMQILKEIATYEPTIKKKDIVDEEGNTIEVEVKFYTTHSVRCKGRGEVGKVRKLKFDSKAMKYIQKWLEVRGEDDCPYLFVTNYKGVKQVSIGTFNNWCHNTFEKVIGRRIHNHLLRESRATNLVVHEGKDIETAKNLLGHNSTETTKIYVIKEDEEEIDDAFIG